MNLVLSHDTAFEFWLSSHSRYKPGFGTITRIPSNTNLAESHGTWHYSVMCEGKGVSSVFEHVGGIGSQMHLLVADASDRCRSDFVISHAWGERPLPDGSIIQLGENLFIVSPELCFLQLAERHRGLPLAWLGSELCGCHAFDPYDRASLLEREPITSRDALASFLDGMPGIRGAKHARTALGAIHDRTRSPRESTVAVLLAASTKMGGQQLPPFEVNSQINLSDEGKLLTDRKYLELDMHWAERSLCLEYNGKPHESADAALRDLEKITALEAQGTTVIPVNKRQFNTYRSFEVIVETLRRELGVRTRPSLDARVRRRDAHFDLIRFERSWCSRPNLRDYAWWRIVEPMVSIETIG